jgi:hypothetical protein
VPLTVDGLIYSTGNSSKSAWCSRGSPSEKLLTSRNLENDRSAAYDSGLLSTPADGRSLLAYSFCFSIASLG